MLAAGYIKQLEESNRLLTQHVEVLSAQNVQLTERVKDLEARLGKNSQNSSKPPSTDGLNKPKPKPKSQRGKSGKKSGGQPGHKGQTLNQVANPDFTEFHPAGTECACCHGSLEGALCSVEIRQEFDIPPVKVQVTEHQVEVKQCKGCGHQNKGDCPITYSVQYGKGVEALAVYLGQYQLLPYARTAQLFKDLFGLSLSEGTLANIYERCYGQLEGFEASVKAQLINAKLVHFDESGMRVKKILYWLHVASNRYLTMYHIDPKRGNEAMDRMGILPHFKGVAVHDHWKSYFQYSCLHSLCNAHHFREFTYHAEEYQQSWCTKMKDLLVQIKKSVEAYVEAGKSSIPEQERRAYSELYIDILNKGFMDEVPKPPEATGKRGRKKKHSAHNLWARLIDFKKEVLAFMGDFTIPFTNNQGEQDIRMNKVKQKISGCFRSDEGAKYFCRIRGFVSTAGKQGLNIFDALRDACNGNPFNPVSA